MLAIAHLREGDLFSAEPLMVEVLRNDALIKSEVTRRLFRREAIDRFDQEGALSAFAKIYPEVKTEAEVHAEAVQLLREGKDEAELLQGLGADTPQAVKDFILKVDRLPKIYYQMLSVSCCRAPIEIVRDRFAGVIVFNAIRRGLYRRICDENSEVHQAWITGGLDKVLAGGLIAVVVLETLDEFQIRFGALAVWATAYVMKCGVYNFCKTNKPRSLMDLRRKKA